MIFIYSYSNGLVTNFFIICLSCIRERMLPLRDCAGKTSNVSSRFIFYKMCIFFQFNVFGTYFHTYFYTHIYIYNRANIFIDVKSHIYLSLDKIESDDAIRTIQSARSSKYLIGNICTL